MSSTVDAWEVALKLLQTLVSSTKMAQPLTTHSSLLPSNSELRELFRLKHQDLASEGWGPRLRARFGYFTPDDVYEATIAGLVTADTAWLDVGGGRDLFPSNVQLAETLSRRARLLVGLDPSGNILENRLVHLQVQNKIEEFRIDTSFDLITLRMVAEHLTDPENAVESMASLVKDGGLVVIFTVNKWSAITLASWITPVRFHHWMKKWLWKTEEQDTFEVAYRMNTRAVLRNLFRRHGFVENSFAYLADCRVFARWKLWNTLELRAWSWSERLRLRYLETCLLGVYQKRDRSKE